jgi:hypothetical protein
MFTWAAGINGVRVATTFVAHLVPDFVSKTTQT